MARNSDEEPRRTTSFFQDEPDADEVIRKARASFGPGAIVTDITVTQFDVPIIHDYRRGAV